MIGLLFLAQESLAQAQTNEGANRKQNSAITSDEVEQLRSEIAAQRRMIEALKAIVERLAAGTANISPAAIVQAPPDTKPKGIALSEKQPDQKSEPKKGADASIPAGWSGEHFFLKSPDGQFALMPVGYLNANYTFYKGDGAPPDTFAIRRARFGVQGNYGKQVDYAFLFDSAASNGISIRDAYLNFKPFTAFQVQVGQFKEPFSEEVGTGDTNVEFLERSIVSALYPSAAGTFRAPGISIHGDIDHGVVLYWAGAFNGKGIIANDTTNEPEFVGRLRLYPWKKSSNPWLKGLAFGGSAGRGRSRGLSNELSFNGTMNDFSYNFFPSLRINGPIERYNGGISWIKGPLGLRSEYTQLNEHRVGIGAETFAGGGFETLPGVVAKGAYAQATYLLTGEAEPENWIPKVRHPVIGPASPDTAGGHGWGAWQLKFRYSYLQAKALGESFSGFTPTSVPTYFAYTDQFSTGFNWYLNYWVLLKFDINVDRLKDPSVQGIPPQNYYVLQQGVQFRF